MRKIGVNCTAARASAPHQTEGARRRRENFWSFYAFTLNFASPTSSSGSAAPHVTTRSTCSATRRTHSCTLRTLAIKDPAKTTHRISALPSRNPAARLHSFAYASARASALPAPPRARLVPCLIDAAASTPPRDTHGPADHAVPPPLSRSSAFVGCRCIGWPSSALTAGSTPARCRSAAARENGQCQ